MIVKRDLLSRKIFYTLIPTATVGECGEPTAARTWSWWDSPPAPRRDNAPAASAAWSDYFSSGFSHAQQELPAGFVQQGESRLELSPEAVAFLRENKKRRIEFLAQQQDAAIEIISESHPFDLPLADPAAYREQYGEGWREVWALEKALDAAFKSAGRPIPLWPVVPQKL